MPVASTFSYELDELLGLKGDGLEDVREIVHIHFMVYDSPRGAKRDAVATEITAVFVGLYRDGVLLLGEAPRASQNTNTAGSALVVIDRNPAHPILLINSLITKERETAIKREFPFNL